MDNGEAGSTGATNNLDTSGAASDGGFDIGKPVGPVGGGSYGGFPITLGSYGGFPGTGTGSYGGFPTVGASGPPSGPGRIGTPVGPVGGGSYGGFPTGGSYGGFPTPGGTYGGFPGTGATQVLDHQQIQPLGGVPLASTNPGGNIGSGSVVAAVSATPGLTPTPTTITVTDSATSTQFNAPVAAIATPSTNALASPAPTTGGGTYKIQAGDTMSTIAEKNGISLQALEGANKDVSNPDLIYPGKSLNIPSANSGSSSAIGSVGSTTDSAQAVVYDANPKPSAEEAAIQKPTEGGTTTGEQSKSPEELNQFDATSPKPKSSFLGRFKFF